MVIKVEKQKEKEREKLSSLGDQLGVSVEEYDRWDGTNETESPRPSKPRRGSGVSSRNESSRCSLLDSVRSSEDETEPPEPPSKRPRRLAATAASSLMAELLGEEML